MDLYEETIKVLKQYKITANKKLGQNFLIDEKIIEEIIKAANISKKDLIIEIGPGIGSLTKSIIPNAGKTICIELDKKMANIISNRFKNEIEIINEDILKVDLKKIAEQNKDKNIKVVANLPYYITTPIIMKLLESNLGLESITVMVQKEVAERLIAKPGDSLSGAITYTVYYYAIGTKIIDVPNNSFIPKPEVTSQVIKLTLRKEPITYIENKEKFFEIIKLAFMQRRKTLVNSLANSKIATKQKIEQILDELNIEKNIRAENLTMEQFAEIAKRI